MCDAVSIYCSQDSEDCPPLYIQRRFSQADGAAQALKSPGASALPKSYKLKLYGFILMDIPGGSDVKVSACNAGDPGSIPGSGRYPGEGNGNPLQYSCLENSMDRGAQWAIVHGVRKELNMTEQQTLSKVMKIYDTITTLKDLITFSG